MVLVALTEKLYIRASHSTQAVDMLFVTPVEFHSSILRALAF